ncbi:Zinc metalloprotease [Pleurotus pulmonarius]
MTRISYVFTLAVVILLSWTNAALGSSAPPRPLKRLAHPETLALEIFPRQPIVPDTLTSRAIPLPKSTILRHDDSFRLTVAAFNETFHLHLRPNEHLIHPAARIHYYTTTSDGRSVLSHTVPLTKESVKAYLGEVLHTSVSPARMREDAAKVAHSTLPTLGWARIVVHHQGDVVKGVAPIFEGAFSVKGDVHHIMTKDNYLRTKHHLDPQIVHEIDGYGVDSSLVIWRDSDAMTPQEEKLVASGVKLTVGEPAARPQSCAHDSLPYNADVMGTFGQKPLTSPSWYETLGFGLGDDLARRDDVVGSGMDSNFVNSIGDTSSCPKEQRLLYMGVASDCKFTAQYGSKENATTRILTDWNTASSLYKSSFNVSLGIIELQIQDPTCPSTPDASIPWNVDCSTVTLNDRLSLFSAWRGAKGDDGVGLWHLMSGCPTGTEVGIAWLATLCQQTSSGQAPSVVSGTAVSTSGRTEWQVIAHEIGHNFGAIHDCADGCSGTQNCCPLSASSCNADARFIMSPVAQAGETNFSPCSLGNICSLMSGTGSGRTNTSCLIDPSQSTRATISLQMCGNGIVESGEDCDPGQGINSPCCDSATCRFRQGAVCDPDSSPCCTQECSFAPTTQVCRAAKDARCDTQETCTGNSSSCPTDQFAPNGQSCGSNDLKCASGLCTSVALQCQTIGASMNLREACPNRGDESCRVSCRNPSQSNSCVLLQAMLVDGSPCGYGGTCQTGRCQAGSFLEKAKAWYTQNLQISIPVTVAAGILALLLLWALITAVRRCCVGRRGRSPTMTPVIVDPALARIRHQRLDSVDRSDPLAGLRRPPSGPPMRTPPGMPGAVPAALRPGSMVAHQRSPYQGGSTDYSAPSYNNNYGPPNWVDDRLYNGSRP